MAFDVPVPDLGLPQAEPPAHAQAELIRIRNLAVVVYEMQLARAARTRAGQQLLAAFLGQVDRSPWNASCARLAGIGGISGEEGEIPRSDSDRADPLRETISR